MLKRFAASLKTSGSGPNKVLSSLVAILLGCAFGGMLLVVIALTVREINFASAWDGIRVVLAGVFNLGRDVNGSGALQFGFNGKLVGDMLFRATPLIMTGLSIAVSYKTGLFNIGAPGQYLAGTAAAIAVGLSVNTEVVPSWIAWLLALLAAMLAGAVWGAIPGIFKAYLNVNEVITSIMTNWIAANMVASVFDGSKFVNKIDYGKTGFTLKLATNGVATAKLGLDKLFPGSSVNAGILLTVLFAVVCWLLMSKSRVGFELRACGSNKNAAKLAGMNEKRNIVLAMAISGALAAAGSALYYLQGDIEFYDKWRDRGLLRTCAGNTINYKDVTAWFLEMAAEYKIVPAWVYYDAWSARYWVEEMKASGFNMIPCIQGAKTLSLPMQNMGADLQAKRIVYNNHPILKWCLTNTGVKTDVNGNIVPVKNQAAKQRIDGMASLLDAYVGLTEKYEEYIRTL